MIDIIRSKRAFIYTNLRRCFTWWYGFYHIRGMIWCFCNSRGRLLRDTCYSLEYQLTTLILMVTKESQQETGVRVGLKVDRQECDGGNGFVGTLIMNLIPCSLRQMVNMGKLWRKGHMTKAHVWPILDSLAQKLHVGPPFPYFFIVHITRSVFPPVITTYKGRNCVNVRY